MGITGRLKQILKTGAVKNRRGYLNMPDRNSNRFDRLFDSVLGGFDLFVDNCPMGRFAAVRARNVRHTHSEEENAECSDTRYENSKSSLMYHCAVYAR